MSALSVAPEKDLPLTPDDGNAAINKVVNTAISRSVTSDKPDVFTSIYEENINIAIWQRELSNALQHAVKSILEENTTAASILAVTPNNCSEVLQEHFGTNKNISALSDDVTLLVDMFCCLFERKRAGLRLTILDRPMCPRFHFDRIPCRLVTTYQGVATQWLENDVIDRSKLGAGNQGKSDETSGLFKNMSDINQLNQGDVALLKGEHWSEKEGFGLVHRSPAVVYGEKRLLLTLDFIDD